MNGGAGGFAPGSTNFDEGGIPTGFNSNNPLADRDDYTVNCMEIGYCDLNGAGTSGWEISFYNDYAPCTFNGAPDSTTLLTGLPANGCWTLTIDLSGGREFCLAGDGGGLGSASVTRTFGWSYRYAGTDGSQPAGFMLAGNPAATDPTFVLGGLPMDGTETYYGPASLCPGAATGLLTNNFWFLEDPTGTNSNCYYLGTYPSAPSCSGFPPYASFLLKLQAESDPCSESPPPTPYCVSNPAFNGVNAIIDFDGTLSAANDQVTMTAHVPSHSLGYFITSRTQGFTATPRGSAGNLCLGGNIGRFVGPGQIKDSGASGTISLDTTAGEWSLASIPTSTGTYAALLGTESYFQLWFRDPSAATISNFSDAYAVRWEN